MRIATWNVNSIRARIENVKNWLAENSIDILLLQEIKCQDEQFPYEIFDDMGYNCLVHGQKSMNGVAILSKFRTHDTVKDLPLYNYKDIYNESRYIETKIEYNGQVFRIASGYFPNGYPSEKYVGIPEESERFHYKLDFYRRFIDYLRAETETNSHEIFIFGGDLNVMHRPIDVHNAKIWEGQIAFLPQERAMLDEIEKLGFIDTYRHFYPDVKEFSWWNYRFGGWPKNHGLRIDYIYTNKIELIKDVRMDKETRGLAKPSDHIPVVVEI